MLLLVYALCAAPAAAAAPLRIAVASNFIEVARELGAAFTAETGRELRFSPGSTGKHYAQIRHGAPYDLFLAADAARPERLEQEGLAVAGSRFTYAVGRLALWASEPGQPLPDSLTASGSHRLAIANPRLAPYGLAAEQSLKSLSLWNELQARLVRGENIAQAFQFVASGNADLGFVSQAQLIDYGVDPTEYWLVPAELHDPIVQQAVLLRDNPAARAFWRFLRGDPARAIIARRGYDLAEGD